MYEFFFICIRSCMLAEHAVSLPWVTMWFFFLCFRGEPKCWYGVPGAKANAFEQVYHIVLDNINIPIHKLSCSHVRVPIFTHLGIHCILFFYSSIFKFWVLGTWELELTSSGISTVVVLEFMFWEKKTFVVIVSLLICSGVSLVF